MPSSALRTARRPARSPAAASTRLGTGCWPSRRDHSRRRRGLGTTPNMSQPASEAPGPGAVDPSGSSGSLPAPLSAPGGECGSRGCERTVVVSWDFGRGGDARACPNRCPNGRGVLRTSESDPEDGPVEGAFLRRAGLAARLAQDFRTPACGAPLPGRMPRQDRPRRPARSPCGGGCPEGGASGRRCWVRSVPALTPRTRDLQSRISRPRSIRGGSRVAVADRSGHAGHHRNYPLQDFYIPDSSRQSAIE